MIAEADADAVEAAIVAGPGSTDARRHRGAGNVGRSIAAELLDNGHEVLLIDSDPDAIKKDGPGRRMVALSDACELSSLEEAKLESCDVVIAATGDDKVNLVISLLAKTEFAVPRTVARNQPPSNEWLFNEVLGVDVGCVDAASGCPPSSRRPSVSATLCAPSRSGSPTPIWSR